MRHLSLLFTLFIISLELKELLSAPLLPHYRERAAKRLRPLFPLQSPEKIVLSNQEEEQLNPTNYLVPSIEVETTDNLDYQFVPVEEDDKIGLDKSELIRSLLRRQKPLTLQRAELRNKHFDNVEHELSEVVNDVGYDQEAREKKGVSRVTVETLVIVDTAFTKQFSSLKEMDNYLSIYWNDVALRFNSIDNPKISIELSAVVPLKKSDEKFIVFAGDGSIKFDDTLKNFGQWVAKTKSLPEHDFAYLMTGRQLQGDVAGFAYEGAICNRNAKMSYSTGIGEDIGATYETTGLAVHEIGHNLGSAHDGTSKSSKCPAGKGNIMTPAPDLLQNPRSLYFSECSINSMYKKFQNEKSKCLLKKSSPKSRFPTTNKLPGDLPKVLNKVCEKYVAGLDVFTFVPQSDCTKVRCAAEGYQDSERNLLAPDGASCGGSKKCLYGKCQ